MNHNENHKQIQITLRGLPPAILVEFKKEARQKKVSLNQILLNRILPPREKPKEGACSELLNLAGTWNKKRARDFDRALGELRKIDSSLWDS